MFKTILFLFVIARRYHILKKRSKHQVIKDMTKANISFRQVMCLRHTLAEIGTLSYIVEWLHQMHLCLLFSLPYLFFFSSVRGDTVRNTCKMVGLWFKLDLRRDYETIVTKCKFFTDQLKFILATKCHLNAFLESLLHISEEEIINVQLPLVQIIGLEANMSSLRLAS